MFAQNRLVGQRIGQIYISVTCLPPSFRLCHLRISQVCGLITPAHSPAAQRAPALPTAGPTS